MKTTKSILAVLLIMAAFVLASCGKTSETEKYLTSCTWGDEVGFEWTYIHNGKLTVFSGSETAVGTWTYTKSTNTLVRIYNFGSWDISRKDLVKSIDANTMILESLDFDGEITYYYNINKK